MILTAHQPVYLPWLGLFDKIAYADTFVSFNQVQYCPKDFQNRNKVKTKDGTPWLTVPVCSSGHREIPMSEITINNQLPWQRKHLRTIQQAYQKAPFYDYIMQILEPYYVEEYEYLVDLNESMLLTFLDVLGIDIDFHQANHFQFQGQKSDLVLDMCKTLGANTYIFGSQGRDYADVKSFNEQGIEVVFQEYTHPEYPQLHGKFEPNLSVIDLLMNCGPDSLEILKGKP